MAGTLIAPVVDGKIKETESQTSLKNAKEKEKKSTTSKDTFLKLLVAEVKNQDPLQPTSNTEWVSQYATFSELETMQNMSASLDVSRASSLVGKTVMIQTTNESGKVSEIQGRVDYITYESGKVYVSVNGSNYSLDDVRNVIDDQYLSAFDNVYAWTVALNKLPAYESLKLEDALEVEALYTEYAKMSDYEKTFVAKENADKIVKYFERIQTIKQSKEEDGKAEAEEVEDKKTEEVQKPETGEATKPEESGAVTPETPKEEQEETKDAGAEGTGTGESGDAASDQK